MMLNVNKRAQLAMYFKWTGKGFENNNLYYSVIDT